jgi:hypothetical protein
MGIGVDAAGNVYVGGNTTSPHFPVTPGAFQMNIGSSDGVADGFVTKLNPAGSALEYSTYLGGNASDGVNAVAVSADGRVYVTGSTASENFPVTSGAFQTFLGGVTDAFVTQLNASGNGLVYSTYLGGSAADAGRGIRIDQAGNAYITGDTASSNYPVTSGAVQSASGGSADAILTVLNAEGNALLYSTYLGGSELDMANSIAIDAKGNAYLTGNTASPDFPVTDGVFQNSLSGGTDAFVAKIEPVFTLSRLPSPSTLTLPPPSPPTLTPPLPTPTVVPGPMVTSSVRKIRRKIWRRKSRKLKKWMGLRRAVRFRRRHKRRNRFASRARHVKIHRLKRVRGKISRSRRGFLNYWRRQISKFLLSHYNR